MSLFNIFSWLPSFKKAEELDLADEIYRREILDNQIRVARGIEPPPEAEPYLPKPRRRAF